MKLVAFNDRVYINPDAITRAYIKPCSLAKDGFLFDVIAHFADSAEYFVLANRRTEPEAKQVLKEFVEQINRHALRRQKKLDAEELQ